MRRAARPRPAASAEAAAERAIRQALRDPGSVTSLPIGRHPPLPVPLWLHPDPPLPLGTPLSADEATEQERDPEAQIADLGRRRRQGERAEMPGEDKGLVTIRMENILTWGEYVRVDRAHRRGG